MEYMAEAYNIVNYHVDYIWHGDAFSQNTFRKGVPVFKTKLLLLQMHNGISYMQNHLSTMILNMVWAFRVPG